MISPGSNSYSGDNRKVAIDSQTGQMNPWKYLHGDIAVKVEVLY